MIWAPILATLVNAANSPNVEGDGGILTTEQMLTGAAIVFSFVGSILGYLLSSWRSKKDTEVQTQTTLKVAAENAAIAGENAATQQFAVLTQGFEATLTRQDRRIDRLVAHIGMQDEDIEALTEHVEKLEELIPTPPGAPERPKLHHRNREIDTDL